MTQTVWFADIEEDPETGDLYMTFPMELIKEMGWNIGDKFNWSVEETGDVTLTKSAE